MQLVENQNINLQNCIEFLKLTAQMERFIGFHYSFFLFFFFLFSFFFFSIFLFLFLFFFLFTIFFFPFSLFLFLTIFLLLPFLFFSLTNLTHQTRQTLKGASPPYIPHLGLHLKDHVFLIDAPAKDGEINVPNLFSVWKSVSSLLKGASVEYETQVDQLVIDFFLSFFWFCFLFILKKIFFYIKKNN